MKKKMKSESLSIPSTVISVSWLNSVQKEMLNINPYNESVNKRFWNYVKKESSDKCWEWRGSRMKRGGYGQLNDRGRLLKAHRVSYEIHRGLIFGDGFVCHTCNNPGCVNPEHLYLGTPKQNWHDTIKSGRAFKLPSGAKGEKHHSAKLTSFAAKIIKKSKARGVDLAKRFGVTPQAICQIRKGLAWKQI